MKVLKSTTPIARRTHFCDYCDGEIKEGEKYFYQFLADGHGNSWQFKTHLNCRLFMEKMQDGEQEGWDRESFQNHIIAEFREIDTMDLFGKISYSFMLRNVLGEFKNKNK